MKLISWNVNGLRACIQKGFLEFFNESNADFFCLQETKLQAGQLQLELPGYEQYWNYAEKKGYSGTAIFTKHTPLQVRYGIGIPELDTEGRVIILEYQEFFLVNCYTPNAQRGLERIDFRLQWEDAFRRCLMALDERKPVILCGDLNVAHQPIDLKNPASNKNSAGFSDQERAAFSALLESGFTDTFRYLNPTATGCYTWWSYMFNARQNNAGWRIDYFLVSDRLRSAIHAAPIHSHILGSDHCPVELDIQLLCNGSVWQSDAEGTARVIQQEKPSSGGKKAVTALIAAALLLSGFAGGYFTRQAIEPQQEGPGIFSYPTLILNPNYSSSIILPSIPIEYVEYEYISTARLVDQVLAIPELNDYATGKLVISAGFEPFYNSLKASYPVLWALERRSDAATELWLESMLTGSLYRSMLAHELLALDPYRNQTIVEGSVCD